MGFISFGTLLGVSSRVDEMAEWSHRQCHLSSVVSRRFDEGWNPSSNRLFLG